MKEMSLAQTAVRSDADTAPAESPHSARAPRQFETHCFLRIRCTVDDENAVTGAETAHGADRLNETVTTPNQREKAESSEKRRLAL